MKKYNVNHDKDIKKQQELNSNGKSKSDAKLHQKETVSLHPWIQYSLKFLVYNENLKSNINDKFNTFLVRIFDEALVWFEYHSNGIVSKLFDKKKRCIIKTSWYIAFFNDYIITICYNAR